MSKILGTGLLLVEYLHILIFLLLLLHLSTGSHFLAPLLLAHYLAPHTLMTDV